MAFQTQSDAELANLQRVINDDRRSAESIATTHAGKIRQLEGDLTKLVARAEGAEAQLHRAEQQNVASAEDRRSADAMSDLHASQIQELQAELTHLNERAEAAEVQLKDTWDEIRQSPNTGTARVSRSEGSLWTAVASIQLQLHAAETDNKAMTIQLDSTRDELEANRLSLQAAQVTAAQEITTQRDAFARQEHEFETRLQQQLEKERETESKTNEVCCTPP